MKSIIKLISTCKLYSKIGFWSFILDRDFKPVYNLPKVYIDSEKYKNNKNIYKSLYKSRENLYFNGKMKKISIQRFEPDKIYEKSEDVFTVKLDFKGSQHPVAEAMLHTFYQKGKLEEKCRSNESCRCFSCTVDLLKKITGEV